MFTMYHNSQETGKPTQLKGLAAHVPSPSLLSPHPSSCCHSPSKVRERHWCLDSSTRELLWHCEHSERGEPKESEPTQHAHFLAEKVHCHVAPQSNSPKLPVLEKERPI